MQQSHTLPKFSYFLGTSYFVGKCFFLHTKFLDSPVSPGFFFVLARYLRSNRFAVLAGMWPRGGDCKII